MTEALGGKLILIVEDNEKNLKLARDVLQFNGFQTLEADSGEAAVGIAREHLPDLVGPATVLVALRRRPWWQ